MAAAFAFSVGACGGDGATTTAPSTTAESTTAEPSSAEPSSTEPSTVGASTTGPSTSEPHEPTGAASDQRLVLLAEEAVLADVLALGLRPVASTASVPEAGFQGIDPAETDGIEVLPMTTLSLEHLASLRPDTIVTLQFWVDEIGEETLRGLGDLLIVPDGLGSAGRITALGELLDRREQAEAVVADLDAATERASAAVPDDCRISLAAIYPGPAPAAFVAGPWDLPTAVVTTGCALDPDDSDAAPDQNGRVWLSLETLDILDAPTLILLQSDTVEGEQEAVDAIESNPLWPLLPAVQSGNVVVFDRLGYPGATGTIRFLDEFAALFG